MSKETKEIFWSIIFSVVVNVLLMLFILHASGLFDAVDQINEIENQLIRLEERLDYLEDRLEDLEIRSEERLENMTVRVRDLSVRIGVLENLEKARYYD